MPISTSEFGPRETAAARLLIALALAEDLDECGDVTSLAVVSPQLRGQVEVRLRQPGVVCGLPLIPLVTQAVDDSLQVTLLGHDGATPPAHTPVARILGTVQSLLTAERTLLNFLTHLSGIATLTAQYVAAVRGTRAVVLDTRKTHPGFRDLEKYAVRMGGGTNHRRGLYDAILIKDNHVAAWQTEHPDAELTHIVSHARRQYPGLPVEIEVDTLEQLTAVLPAQPECVLLDNMTLGNLRAAVHLRDAFPHAAESDAPVAHAQVTNTASLTALSGSASRILLEASGGVNLTTIRAIAETGVDRISVGALTHSATALDLGLDWVYTA